MFNPILPPGLVQAALGQPRPKPPKNPGLGGVNPQPPIPTIPGIWGGGKPSQLQLARMMYIRAMLGG